MQTTTNTNALKRISFLELGRTLGIASLDLRGIVAARGFPAFAGLHGGQRMWRVADVAAWLESRGWGADADAVRDFAKAND